MKKSPHHLFAAFLLLMTIGSAMSQQIPNGQFSDTTTSICPAGPGDLYHGFSDWEAYQTKDSTWDGDRDSNCIDLRNPGELGSAHLRMDYLDTQKPVYLRSLLDSSNKIQLDSNALYQITTTYNSTANLVSGGFCADGVCSGMKLGIEVPDTGLGDTKMRWYEQNIPIQPEPFSFCFTTEKFDGGNFLREAFYKAFPSGNNAGNEVAIDNVEIENITAYAQKIKKISTTNFNGTEWDHYFDYLGGWPQDNIILMHNSPGYPSNSNMGLVPVAPTPNTSDQQTINVHIGNYQVMIPQPYTDIIGDTVIGDTLRHHVNLINNGGTLCLTGQSVDMGFEQGDNYVHKAGKIEFFGTTACMLFGKGSRLIVPDNVRMEYGRPGHGMLALKTGGSIDIGKNAELVVNNKMVIGEYKEDQGPRNIYIILREGSKLTFGERSRLSNYMSKSKETRLYVYMKGGVLDDSNLSEWDKRLIVRVEDPGPSDQEEALKVLGNPVTDLLRFSVLLNHFEPVKASLMDLNWKAIETIEFSGHPGENIYEIPIRKAPYGLYFLKIERPDGPMVAKIIKQ